MHKVTFCFLCLIALLILPATTRADQVVLYAAGSLKAALSDVVIAYEKSTGYGLIVLDRAPVEAWRLAIAVPTP